MHMVILAVELDQFSLKVKTSLREDDVQVIQDFFGEHIASIFGDEDQMNVHQKYTVSSVSNVWIVSHRPNTICACSAFKPTNSN